MEKRVFFNPAINDTATFIKTAEETNGQYSLLEIELYKSDGPPLHYHNAFTEKFEVIDGILYLQVGKVKKVLHPGESFLVPKGTPHRFYNTTNELVKFRITLQPGHVGMENFIKIIYSLAQDCLTDEKGKPKNFAHLASILIMSDSNASGMMSLLSPIIRMVAKKAKKDGTEKWLLDKYCN
ncbi:MAG: cupin domain-containing protein [Bacteroidota bacterium]